MKTTLLLLALAACSPSAKVQEIECTDRDGSDHIIGDAQDGGIIEAVWCGEDPSDGLECHDMPWWFDGDDIVTSCPAVREGGDLGVLWVRVSR